LSNNLNGPSREGRGKRNRRREARGVKERKERKRNGKYRKGKGGLTGTGDGKKGGSEMEMTVERDLDTAE